MKDYLYRTHWFTTEAQLNVANMLKINTEVENIVKITTLWANGEAIRKKKKILHVNRYHYKNV